MQEVFEPEKTEPKAEKLQFEGVGDKDVYNITAPFKIGDDTYIAGRMESPEGTADASAMFFIKKNDAWKADLVLPNLKLEDPFIKYINGKMIFGGVETYPVTNEFKNEGIGYRTVFYKGKDLKNLERFATGPDMMKDIRLVELLEGKIGMFTRPQGSVGGRGKICFIKLNSLNEITPENILKASMIGNLFNGEEWGGVNDAYLLSEGKIGVIGHIASEDANGEKHYRAMSFVFNPETFETSPMKIIAERKNFPEGKAKRPELKDVVFPGGYENGMLYAGLSDAEAGVLRVADPFK